MDERSAQRMCSTCGLDLAGCKCRRSTSTMVDELASPGDVIADKYQVVRSLGRGGSATVFLVRHAKTMNLYALKMLNSDVLDVLEVTQRFEREAHAISKLHHGNLVALYDYGHYDGHPYFVTDFVQGKSLSKLLQEEGPMLQRRACRLFVQICDAMQYIHEAGLIHRDLKPGNILLVTGTNDTERVMIVDFGIVKFVEMKPLLDNKLTQEGTVVGSPTYMSPEQCQGHPIDARSDIYSLGCMLYEVLGGRRPFEGDYPFAILVKHVSEPPPRLRTNALVSSIDPKVEAIVMKTLEKDPKDRPQTMSELRRELMPFTQ